MSHPALTEAARRAQLAASEREREPRLRGAAGVGRRAGRPAPGAGAEPRPGSAPCVPGSSTGADHCGRHRTSAPAPHGQAPWKTWSWSALRAGAGAACLSAGKGGPLLTQLAMETGASKVLQPHPQDPDSRTQVPLPPGVRQMSVISFHKWSLFRQQPAIVMISFAPVP